MRIAALQMDAFPGDVFGNLKAIADAALDAEERGAALLVAPELAITGYGAEDEIRSMAQAPGGEFLEMIGAAAEVAGIAIVAGFSERDGDVLYNSALLAAATGQTVIYRKRHLYGAYERELFAPGDRAPQLVDLGGLKVGVLICYDVEFPEAVRQLAVAGADLVLVPTALPESEHAAFIAEKLVPVRAFENQVCIVYANHAGADGRFAYAGRSCIVLPDGSDAARAGPGGAELIFGDYEPANVVACRAANPYLADLRRELF